MTVPAWLPSPQTYSNLFNSDLILQLPLPVMFELVNYEACIILASEGRLVSYWSAFMLNIFLGANAINQDALYDNECNF